MSPFILRIVVSFFTGLALLPPPQVVEPAPSPQQSAPVRSDDDDKKKEEAAPRRSPFGTSRAMQDEAGTDEVGGVRFQPADDKSRVPYVVMRGYIEDDSRALAIIEVEGSGTFVVRAGDTLSLQQGQGEASVLRIVDVSNLSVQVELGSLGHVIVVR